MEQLKDLIIKFGENKKEMDCLKKICDADNKEIKAIMKKSNLSEVNYDGWVAKYSIRKDESMNEAKLLQIIKNIDNVKELGIIKTIEVVDMDALEDAIYNDKISKDTLLAIDTCRTIEEVEVLKVSKEKKKKEDK